MTTLNMKRSSCASGSGYVPSCSIGFCVASTKNGRSSGYVRAGRRDVVLLHRFEQRGLRLRRRPVDLVGEDDVREDRPLDELQPPVPLLFLEDLGAGDVGRHQVGRELNALEVEIEDVGERLDQQRLRQARHAGDQAVSAREQRDQHFFDDFVLADDDLAQLRENLLAAFGDAFGCGDDIHIFFVQAL